MADNLIMEERTEVMVSPSGSHKCFRTAHFLTPSVASTGGAVPSPVSSISAADSATKCKDLPLKANFVGWAYPKENWKTWVNQMSSLHHSTWKKAGIFEAIMGSTDGIQRNDDLILGLAEKWCPTTNSFVFPWGEATITLEDVMILGGYSVLGEFVSNLPENEEIEKVVKKLHDARSDIYKTKVKLVYFSKWMAKFMGSESEIEHEAFLAYWLSRFVFPLSRDAVCREVLPIAVRLAKGTRIALAPAVLASIYKRLTRVNTDILSARRSPEKEAQNSVLVIPSSATLALVQVWIWERFPSLQPKPNSIGQNEPRLARWHNIKKLSSADVSHKINSGGESFQWRPYVNPLSNFHKKIYKDIEYCSLLSSKLDEDFQTLIRCLRPSELVGFEANCIEHYLPHRVAMQFGLDQDIPGHVEHVNSNPEVAWSDYCRPVRDTKLYVPPRLSEPRVTTRYLKWWRKVNIGMNVINEGLKVEKSEYNLVPQQVAEIRQGLSGKVSCKSSKRKMLCSQVEKIKDEFVPQQVAEITQGLFEKSCKSSKRKLSDYNAPVSPPPGFSPKHSPVKESESGFEINEMGESESGFGIDEMGAELSSSGSCMNNHCEEDGKVKSHITNSEYCENDGVNVNLNPVESSSSEAFITGLEDRIRNVEKLYALIQSGKLVCL